MALNNTKWILTDWSRHVLPGDKLVTLAIDQSINGDAKNNRLSGQGFCNRYTASFEALDNNHVKIGPVISTRMACLPAARMTIENDFLAQIQAVSTIEVVSGRLVLQTSDDKTLIFAPQ